MKKNREKSTISSVERYLVKHQDKKTVLILSPLNLFILASALSSYKEENYQYSNKAFNDIFDTILINCDRVQDAMLGLKPVTIPVSKNFSLNKEVE